MIATPPATYPGRLGSGPPHSTAAPAPVPERYMTAEDCRHPAPTVGAEIIAHAAPGTVTRVHSAGDPNSPIDAVVYVGNVPRVLPNLRHGPSGWEHSAEVLDRRKKELDAESSGEPVARIGGWVRYSHQVVDLAHSSATQKVVRGKITAIEPVELPSGKTVAKLTLILYPLDLPTDASIPDEPLPGVGPMLSFPLDLDNPSAVEGGHPGAYEFMHEDRLFTIGRYPKEWIADHKRCTLCGTQSPTGYQKVNLDRQNTLPATREISLCAACQAHLADFIDAKIAAGVAAAKERIPVSSRDPRHVTIARVLLLDEHPAYERTPPGYTSPVFFGIRAENLETLAVRGNEQASRGEPVALMIEHPSTCSAGSAPVLVGYVDNLIIDLIPNSDRWGLFGDLNIKRVHLQAASHHPRVSVELAAPDYDRLSAVALLDANPERDLPPVDFEPALNVIRPPQQWSA